VALRTSSKNISLHLFLVHVEKLTPGKGRGVGEAMKQRTA
jgi:hypothetical protein